MKNVRSYSERWLGTADTARSCPTVTRAGHYPPQDLRRFQHHRRLCGTFEPANSSARRTLRTATSHLLSSRLCLPLRSRIPNKPCSRHGRPKAPPLRVHLQQPSWHRRRPILRHRRSRSFQLQGGSRLAGPRPGLSMIRKLPRRPQGSEVETYS